MNRIHMNRIRWTRFTILIAAALWLLALTVTPALAQGGDLGDQICTGDNYTVREGQSVGTVLAFGCNVTVEKGATVRGDISLFGANATVDGTVNGSIVAFGGNIAVNAGANVDGDVSTIGGNTNVDPAATVHGTIGRNTRPPRFTPHVPTVSFGDVRPRGFFAWGVDILMGIVTAIAFAALGALVILFAPGPTRRVGEAAHAQPLGSAGIGCLTLIVLPILGILLAITVIGIPVALVLVLAAAIAWIFGWIAIGYLAGERILKALNAREILPVVAVVVGILVLAVIGQVPLLGWLVSLLVGTLGIGAVVLTRFGTRPYPPAPTMTMVPVGAPSGSGISGTSQAFASPTPAPTNQPSTSPRSVPPAETPPSATSTETPPPVEGGTSDNPNA